MDLSVGLDTTPSETAALANREGEPIQLPPAHAVDDRLRDGACRSAWPSTFRSPPTSIASHELLIVGLRMTQTPAQNADALGRSLHRSSVQPRLRVRPAEHPDEQQRRRRLRAPVAHRAHRGGVRPRAAAARVHTRRWPPTARPPRARSASPLTSSRLCRRQVRHPTVANEPRWIRARRWPRRCRPRCGR